MGMTWVAFWGTKTHMHGGITIRDHVSHGARWSLVEGG